MWLAFISVVFNIALLILSLFLLRKFKKEKRKTINRELAIQKAKLNAVEEVIVGLAHALRNPLGIALQGVGNLEGKSFSETDTTEVLTIIKNSILRCSNIINAIANFSATTEITMIPPDINSVIENALEAVKNNVKLNNIEISKDIPPNLPKVLADEKKMREAFSHIFLNAVQAMPNGGRLLIRSYLTQVNTPGNKIGRRIDDYYRPGEKVLMLEIEDTGFGIPTQHVSRVFEPFFTDKVPPEGLGLGLWITKNIIESQGGLIEIESKEKKGTKVTVKLRMA